MSPPRSAGGKRLLGVPGVWSRQSTAKFVPRRCSCPGRSRGRLPYDSCAAVSVQYLLTLAGCLLGSRGRQHLACEVAGEVSTSNATPDRSRPESMGPDSQDVSMAEGCRFEAHPEVPEIALPVLPLVPDRHGLVNSVVVNSTTVVDDLDTGQTTLGGQQPDHDTRRIRVDAVVNKIGERRLKTVVCAQAPYESGIRRETDPADHVLWCGHGSTLWKEPSSELGLRLFSRTVRAGGTRPRERP